MPQQNWYTKKTIDKAATMNATIKYADSILESWRYLTTEELFCSDNVDKFPGEKTAATDVVFISTCSGSKVENVLLISEDCAITAKKGFAICGTIKEPIPNPKCRICNGPVAFSFHKFRINFCPAVKDGIILFFAHTFCI